MSPERRRAGRLTLNETSLPNPRAVAADRRAAVRARPAPAVVVGAASLEPLHAAARHRSGDAGDRLETFAWCTGGGQGYIEKAVAMGADAFITGEVSEQTIHVARELGIHFFAAGHHATERYGIKAVGEWLSSSFDITVDFIDIDNPA